MGRGPLAIACIRGTGGETGRSGRGRADCAGPEAAGAPALTSYSLLAILPALLVLVSVLGVVGTSAKVCWSSNREQPVETVHRLWPTELLPGELAQVLPTPAHFEQASGLVTREMVADAVTCGDEVEEHVEAVRAYVRAGFDEVHVGQIGPDQEVFFEAYRELVLPVLGR
ncbi:LLM class oxidoreductase [Kitasatospora purpeofusca]|uniref:hypothetical protein n=1 Tax=Kitasatospora purpeofusca TaxID=67352 RepID=UPI00367F1D61